MLASVQYYLKGELAGLQSAMLDPLEAVIQPPVLADIADHPYAYIWAGRGQEATQTAPKVYRNVNADGSLTQGGYLKMTWQIAVWLYALMAQDDPNIELAFPALIDMVTFQLNTTPPTVNVTDPVTGQLSELINIAQKVEIEYATALVTTGPAAGLVRFGCEFIVYVEEKTAWTEGLP